jgi:hypothetical protein
VVSKAWIEAAIRAHEDVTDVTVVTFNIARHASGHHTAKIVAKVRIRGRFFKSGDETYLQRSVYMYMYMKNVFHVVQHRM